MKKQPLYLKHVCRVQHRIKSKVKKTTGLLKTCYQSTTQDQIENENRRCREIFFKRIAQIRKTTLMILERKEIVKEMVCHEESIPTFHSINTQWTCVNLESNQYFLQINSTNIRLITHDQVHFCFVNVVDRLQIPNLSTNDFCVH